MSIVTRFADAFNRQDVDALVDCFTEDGSYDDIFFGPHAGRAKLREMFERMFHEGKGYRWEFTHVVEDARRAAGEWRFSYTVSDAIPRSAWRARAGEQRWVRLRPRSTSRCRRLSPARCPRQ